MNAVSAWLAMTSLLAGQEPSADFYQDFRGGRRPSPACALIGLDAGEATRFEAGGLRITLPSKSGFSEAVGVMPKFVLAGDFEVTGSFELLFAAPDREGAGVILSLAASPTQNKIARLGRLHRGG